MSDFTIIFIYVVVVAVLAFVVVQSLKKEKPEFDERQELLRGKAYQYGFLSILIYGAVYISLSLLLEKQFMMADTALMIGMFISLVIYAVYCVWKEAFFALKRSPKYYIVLLIGTVILNGISGVETILDGSIVQNGMLSIDSVHLFSAVSFAVILFAIITKRLISNREEE